MTTIRCGIAVRERTTVVALLAWVYRDQKADRMSGRELYGSQAPRPDPENYHGGWSGDGCAAVQRMGRVGAIIRDTSHAQRPALHPDAEAVHDLVVELSRTDPLGARLLWHHGRHGDIPDFWDAVPTPEPLRRRTRNNRLKIVEDATLPGNSHLEYQEHAVAGGDRQVGVWAEVAYPFCPLVYSPALEEVAEAQADYRAWWQALARLAALLPSLKRWTVEGLGAEECPWAKSNPRGRATALSASA